MSNTQLQHRDHLPSKPNASICLLTDQVDSPENIGSLFRLADALAVEKIFLCGGSSIPPNPKIRKTSRAAEKYVPYEHFASALDAVKQIKGNGYKLICLELTQKSISLADLEMNATEKVCIVLGNERHGVSQELIDHAEICVRIPMLGRNSSMNVAMAAAIAMYEINRKLGV